MTRVIRVIRSENILHTLCRLSLYTGKSIVLLEQNEPKGNECCTYLWINSGWASSRIEKETWGPLAHFFLMCSMCSRRQRGHLREHNSGFWHLCAGLNPDGLSRPAAIITSQPGASLRSCAGFEPVIGSWSRLSKHANQMGGLRGLLFHHGWASRALTFPKLTRPKCKLSSNW